MASGHGLHGIVFEEGPEALTHVRWASTSEASQSKNSKSIVEDLSALYQAVLPRGDDHHKRYSIIKGPIFRRCPILVSKQRWNRDGRTRVQRKARPTSSRIGEIVSLSDGW